jgi:dynein heavy chain
MQSIELLKILLKVISEIKDISMDMEFKIIEVQEQFRMLNMYEYEIEPEIQSEVDKLMSNWEELMDFADRRNFEVNDFKQNYSAVTKEEVKGFQQQIKEEYEKYVAKGPGTNNVSLVEGVELLKESKEKIAAFNKKREENVSAEKLFELEISKYPELIAMEESNKKYDIIYNVYIEYDKKVQDFSAMSWTKMDVTQLI